MAHPPTVGRVLHYYPGRDFMGYMAKGEPLVAFVTAVWTDVLINIGGFDCTGVPYAKVSVRLLREGESRPESGGYCVWPPKAPVIRLVPIDAPRSLDWDASP